MKYPYMVNKNGIYYPAGTEVPEGDANKHAPTKGFLDLEDLKTYELDALKKLATDLGVEFTDETTHEELAELCSKVEVDVPQTEDSKVEYKKSDISRMNLERLKALATDLGLEVAEKTGAALKEEIIAKLGL